MVVGYKHKLQKTFCEHRDINNKKRMMVSTS